MDTSAPDAKQHRETFGFNDIPSFDRLDGSDLFTEYDPFGDGNDDNAFNECDRPRCREKKELQERKKNKAMPSSTVSELKQFQVASTKLQRQRPKPKAKSTRPIPKRASSIQQWNYLINRMELLDPSTDFASSSFHSSGSRMEEQPPGSTKTAADLVSANQKPRKHNANASCSPHEMQDLASGNKQDNSSLNNNINNNAKKSRPRPRRQSMPALVNDQATPTKLQQQVKQLKKTIPVRKTISDLTMPSFEGTPSRKKEPRQKRRTTMPTKPQRIPSLDIDTMSGYSEGMQIHTKQESSRNNNNNNNNNVWNSPVSTKSSNSAKGSMVDRSPRPPVRYMSQDASVCSSEKKPNKHRALSLSQRDIAKMVQEIVPLVQKTSKVATPPPKPHARHDSHNPSQTPRQPTRKLSRTTTSSTTASSTSVNYTFKAEDSTGRGVTTQNSKIPISELFVVVSGKPGRKLNCDANPTATDSSPKLSNPRNDQKETANKTTESIVRDRVVVQRSCSVKRSYGKDKAKGGTLLKSTSNHSNSNERGRESSTSSHGIRKRQQKRMKSCPAERRRSHRDLKQAMTSSLPENLTPSRIIENESPGKCGHPKRRPSATATGSSNKSPFEASLQRSRRVARLRLIKANLEEKASTRNTPLRSLVRDDGGDSTGYSSVRSLQSVQERRGRGNKTRASKSMELQRSLQGLGDSPLLMPRLVKGSNDTRSNDAKADAVWARRKSRSTSSLQSGRKDA